MKTFPISNGMKYFVYGVIGVVCATIIVGFFVVGSPSEERAKQLDLRRINDLTNLQYQIINYWQAKEKLPDTLLALKDDLRGVAIPSDPETGSAYEYKIKGSNQFELCATFVRAGQGYVTPSDEWKHDAGRTCFTRTIDKDLYPPIVKQY